MTTNEPSGNNEILDKLGIIINLISRQITKDMTITDSVKLLAPTGLPNKQLAQILNTSEGSIRDKKSKIAKRRITKRRD